ncbi:hypothetical protein WG78_07000 [Amantichitinum ursilacus]|uniref:Uncharacterized protein n=1 Tax=Amantichitinum ursilacus TaxID=857265 RepID=A0A0N0GPL5_9NEIS|nr:hypothetical protein WG78_07000 [Amantichitinum ursilacus]
MPLEGAYLSRTHSGFNREQQSRPDPRHLRDAQFFGAIARRQR